MLPIIGERRGLLRRLFGRPHRGGDDAAELEANLEAAVAAHEAWKTRLLEAVIVGSCSVTPAVVSLDNQCPFGVWLYEECGRKTRESPHYEHIRKLHGRFHVVAGRILGQALSGQQQQATQAMRYGGEYDQMSSELIAAVNNWRESIKVQDQGAADAKDHHRLGQSMRRRRWG